MRPLAATHTLARPAIALRTARMQARACMAAAGPLDQFYKDSLRVGSLKVGGSMAASGVAAVLLAANARPAALPTPAQCFTHFHPYLKGREELVVTVFTGEQASPSSPQTTGFRPIDREYVPAARRTCTVSCLGLWGPCHPLACDTHGHPCLRLQEWRLPVPACKPSPARFGPQQPRRHSVLDWRVRQVQLALRMGQCIVLLPALAC